MISLEKRSDVITHNILKYITMKIGIGIVKHRKNITIRRKVKKHRKDIMKADMEEKALNSRFKFICYG